MSAGHTPLPWHVGEGAQTRIIYAQDGFAVADATVFHARHEASADDNAAFIVRACNRDHLFDEMVKALERAAEDFEDTKLLLEQGLAKRELIIRSVETKEKAVRAVLAKVVTC